ncbi:hypothetical protein [Leucobacter sp. GX24907]
MTTERLIRLRAEARIERDALLEHRGRLGEDPAASITELPSVDELVVLSLRDEIMEDRGRLAEFALTRMAARSSGPEAETHRLNADRYEFEVLREIAAAVPQLTVAIWQIADRLRVS